MDEYWIQRNEETQERLTTKNIKQTEQQLKKYYNDTMTRVIEKFKSTYNHLLATVGQGRAPTPADLYNLDKYWQLQNQLKKELQKLGDNQMALCSERFEQQYAEIYRATALKSDLKYGSANTEGARQMVNSIWCADGKHWSQRVWENTSKLQQELNDNLIDCVVAGRKSAELKSTLMKSFGVSYDRADCVVRTELANLQTQAARKRYQDYGIREVEVRVAKDETTCPICNKLNGKRYDINGKMPVPIHPRCRCCVIPVVDMSLLQGQTIKNN